MQTNGENSTEAPSPDGGALPSVYIEIQSPPPAADSRDGFPSLADWPPAVHLGILCLLLAGAAYVARQRATLRLRRRAALHRRRRAEYLERQQEATRDGA